MITLIPSDMVRQLVGWNQRNQGKILHLHTGVTLNGGEMKFYWIIFLNFCFSNDIHAQNFMWHAMWAAEDQISQEEQ